MRIIIKYNTQSTLYELILQHRRSVDNEGACCLYALSVRER